MDTFVYAILYPFKGLYLYFIDKLPYSGFSYDFLLSNILENPNKLHPKFLPIVIKLCTCLAVLIVIRGGVPRFRYDLLTKLGWVKFLLYVLAFFLMTLMIFLI